ncbi:hypothetical protein [Streptomyces sp. NRRL F-2799]|uniref:hypothetical protein n=1 Tax=Streptomyces sp. NRRL F-2799 TaxID=1463844 RepID=UPI0004CA493B
MTRAGAGVRHWFEVMFLDEAPAGPLAEATGATGVSVASRPVRRTVSANSVIASVFNSATVASPVAALPAD